MTANDLLLNRTTSTFARLYDESANEAKPFKPIIVGSRIIFIDREQSWFWTDEWQAGESEVDQYIAEGNFESSDSLDVLFDEF